jgi:hypothetical protein
MKPVRLAFLLIVLSCIAIPGWTAAAAQPAELLRDTITTLFRARDSVMQSQLEGANSGTARDGQSPPRYQHSREDVLLFVSYLEGRIYQYCRELYLLAGPGSLEGLPCPASAGDLAGISRYDSVPESSGQTSAEKVAGLEGELNEALGEFDEMLLKEQERVAAHVPRQRESGSMVGGAPGEAGRKQQGEQSGAGDAVGGPDSSYGTEPPTDSSAGVEASAGGGAGSGQQQSRLPPTSGSREISSDDDDIVARQLREAAEQEPDPEIKAKLWEEYKKYKEGIK